MKKSVFSLIVASVLMMGTATVSAYPPGSTTTTTEVAATTTTEVATTTTIDGGSGSPTTAAPTTSMAGTLPETGSGSTGLTTVALGLLLAGLAFFGVAHTRRSRLTS